MPGTASISAVNPINPPNRNSGLPPIGHAVTIAIHGLDHRRSL
jgi:hypothetical protein